MTRHTNCCRIPMY